MFVAFYRFLASVCLFFGFKKWAIGLTVASVELLDIQIPIIHMTNEGHVKRREIPDFGVVYENRDAIAELGVEQATLVKIPESILDVN